MKKKDTIICLTTDPYDNIYGYSLVFFKFFDYLQKNNNSLEIKFASNDGVSSKIIKNRNFIILKINNKSNILMKTLHLSYLFLKFINKYDRSSILIANCEIPEMLAVALMKIYYNKSYCIIQDLRVRDNDIKTIMICKIREFLMRRIKNIIFTNKYTMITAKGDLNKYYMGNPVF